MDMHRYAVEEAIRLLAIADSLSDDNDTGHVVMTADELRGLLRAAGMENRAIDDAVHHAFHEHGAAKMVALDDTWASAVRCPQCGGRPRPILWGMPTADMGDLADAGIIAIGGCVVSEDMPTVRCGRCGAEWDG
jgi:DNA-directed RNA polymerase subunit RPC12/RpoP